MYKKEYLNQAMPISVLPLIISEENRNVKIV